MTNRQKKSRADSVRDSRAGDQFHYLWAARECLKLLSPGTRLVAIAIEGASPHEMGANDRVDAGEEVIDVAEYYGTDDVTDADLVSYIQLKHSTKNPNVPWTPSGLKETIAGFGARYSAFVEKLGSRSIDGRLQFVFISNRPISDDLNQAVSDIASSSTPRHPKVAQKLRSFTSLGDADLVAFCKCLTLEGKHEHYQMQRSALHRETYGYLADNDEDAPVRLKNLVEDKALPESKANPCIRKTDVLRALGSNEDELFPANSLLESPEGKIARSQEVKLVSEIERSQTAVVVHAAGGVGKSVIAKRIADRLPKNSVSIVYDCFGNGQYRQRSKPRHRHRDALVQIGNEIASLGLCDPLIPTGKADEPAYLRAFIRRLRQAVSSIRARAADGNIWIVIDAADNAEIAAEKFGDGNSFARDLLREDLPGGVKLVILCRSERRKLLEIPPGTKEIELLPFTREETARFLRLRYPKASEPDVEEFHRLTGGNPRLQAYVVSRGRGLQGVLSSVGPDPTSVDEAIEEQLAKALAAITDNSRDSERKDIWLICTGLAVLKPPVPISVLAAIAKVEESAIRSFASDFGRPLHLSDDTLQFRDEPVETWFMSKFGASKEQLKAFIDILEPLAAESAYVASCLPFLMFEAGCLTDLIDMALDGKALPKNRPVDQREIELRRLQFALKASLYENRYLEAAKLALRAGEETAGDTRQQRLIQRNTDLIAVLLAPANIQEILSRRYFSGEWLGARHAYEAGLLSHIEHLKGDARNKLRMAYDWLIDWSKLSDKEREKENVEDTDIAEIALAHLNLHGAKVCADELRIWNPKTVSFRAGRIVATRLVDHGRFDQIEALASARRDNLYLLLAIALELRSVHRVLPKQSAERALELLNRSKEKWYHDDFGWKSALLLAVVSIVEAAYHHRLTSPDELAAVLDKHLPSEPPRALYHRFDERRYALLSGYSLCSALRGKDLQLLDLANPELREQLSDERAHLRSEEARGFQREIGAILPWHKLRSGCFVSKDSCPDLAAAIENARSESIRVVNVSYGGRSDTADEIAGLWFDILLLHPDSKHEHQSQLMSWVASLSRPLFTPTWNALARTAARTKRFENTAYDYCQRAFELTHHAAEDSESKAETYISSSRALLALDKAEAQQYLDRAIEVVSKLGDEVFERWNAVMDLADRAGESGNVPPALAYRFARCAEVAKEYVYDNFDWKATVSSLCALSPSEAVATLSRWRDRGVGWIRELLPALILRLLYLRKLNPKLACAFLAFQGKWDYVDVLKYCFSACMDFVEQQQILDHALGYIRLTETYHGTWRELADLANANRLGLPDIGARAQFHLAEKSVSERTSEDDSARHVVSRQSKCKVDWKEIFANTDIHTLDGLAAVYGVFEKMEPPREYDEFVSQLVASVQTGRECSFIEAIAGYGQLSLSIQGDVLMALPAEWTSRMSVRQALTNAVKLICNERCTEVGGDRRYSVFSLQTASELSGLPRGEVAEIVLDGLGRRAEVLDSRRLFRMIGLLTTKLSPEEASNALDFALSRFEKMLDEKDGDGPWLSTLQPPASLEESLAGFLWASLGAPEASFRWEAAHVVRSACRLNQSAVVDELIRRARSDDVRPFVDAGLEFYRLHARQYLMIALARAAGEYPSALRNHVEFFLHFALNDEPHVIIRRFAADAALSLERSGSVELEAEISERLASVNSSAFSDTRSDEREIEVRLRRSNGSSERFHFGLDMESYWYSSLARCFGLSVPDISHIAEQVICDVWGFDQNGYWNRDERGKRGLYGERGNWHSHGAYPKVDDLSFYLSYHAMMVAAGRLLASQPVELDEYEGDAFQRWLTKHLLTRSDGRWLADRRDPEPLERRNWESSPVDKDWRWLVTHTDFDEVLGVSGARRRVWGSWTVHSGANEEEIEIRSALVSRATSNALLVALQTSDGFWNYKIPDFGDELEINSDNFSLMGWVEDADVSNRLDKFDPWSGDLKYPPLRLAAIICNQFNLRSDDEQRVWYSTLAGKSQEVLWSQIWGEWSGDEWTPEHGRRLEIEADLLSDMLFDLGMDLIIEVSIQRRKLHQRYETRSSEDEIDFVEPYCKLFLLRADGQLDDLRQCSRIREEANR